MKRGKHMGFYNEQQNSEKWAFIRSNKFWEIEQNKVCDELNFNNI